MKRILSILLIAVLVFGSVASFASCDTKPGASDFEMPEGGFDTETPITITFYHSMGAALQEILNDAIADFNELYPNITVVHESLGDYDGVRDQIKTEISVGNQPNIAYCYADHVALYNLAGAVQTLDTFINDPTYGYTEEQLADFVPGYYAEGKAFGDDKMYTLPISKSTEVLYYNATFFAENGLEFPTTWDEMEELCKKIKQIDPDCIPLGYDSEANWFITMCEQYGSPYTSAVRGQNFLFNNDQNKAFVKEFRSWYEAGYVTTQELYGGYTSGLFTEMSGKKCYMSIGSTGGAMHQVPDDVKGVYPFEVGIAPIPQINPENPKAISQGPSLCIFDNSDKQEVAASWLFVKFLTTNKEFQAEFSMTSGYMPVIKSVSEVPAYQNYLAGANGTTNIVALAVSVGIEMENYYFVSPAFNGSSIARDKVGVLMQYCFVTPATDVDAMINKAFNDAIKACEAGH